MSDDGMTYEQFRSAMSEGRAISKHFEEIRMRVHTHAKVPELAYRSGQSLLGDALCLVGCLQLMLDENDRLIAFLIGLEDAGTITRRELELLMGLRRG